MITQRESRKALSRCYQNNDVVKTTRRKNETIITLEYHYPTWAITPPWYYSNDEDYVTATGLLEQIEQISTLT